jgi:hypothetical protein
MKKTLFKAADLPSWTVVDFAACDLGVLRLLVTGLKTAMAERGKYLLSI